MPKKPDPKKPDPKKQNPKKVDDLVKAIQSRLKDSLSKEYVKTNKKPRKPTKPESEKHLSDLDDTGLNAAVKYAVEDKWQTDTGPNQHLKIKGDKMVKAITNLKKK